MRTIPKAIDDTKGMNLILKKKIIKRRYEI
jgi:hypothetical protein